MIVKKTKANPVIATVSSLVSYGGSSDESSDNETESHINESSGSDVVDNNDEPHVVGDFFGINSKSLEFPITNLPSSSSFSTFSESNEQLYDNVIVGPAKPQSMVYIVFVL